MGGHRGTGFFLIPNVGVFRLTMLRSRPRRDHGDVVLRRPLYPGRPRTSADDHGRHRRNQRSDARQPGLLLSHSSGGALDRQGGVLVPEAPGLHARRLLARGRGGDAPPVGGTPDRLTSSRPLLLNSSECYGAVARQPVPTGQAKSESFSASETKAPFTPVSAFSALVPRACTRACCRLDFTAETGHQRSPRPSGLPCRNQSKARGSEG